MNNLKYDPMVDVLHIQQIHTETGDFMEADKYIQEILEDLNTDQCAYDPDDHQLVYVDSNEGIMMSDDIIDKCYHSVQHMWFEPIC